MKTLCVVILAAGFAAAQPALKPPGLGMMVDAEGSLRPVLGLPGNLLLSDAAAQDVLSAGFSGKYAVVKTSSSLNVLDADGQVRFSMDAEEGPALFAFAADGSPALAYMAGALWRWSGSAFEASEFKADALQGEALALAGDSSRPVFLVQRDDAIWRVESQTGAQNALPGVEAPVLLRVDGTVLYADGTALVIRSVSGDERRIETGAAIGTLRWMGDGWICAIEQDSLRQFAIRITRGREAVSQLPEAQ